MDNKLVAATALAGSLAMASFVWGTAQATPAPSAIHAPGNGITLVGHQGGGGGGGGGGGPGGGGGGGGSVHVGGGGGGGGPGLSGGGGGRELHERWRRSEPRRRSARRALFRRQRSWPRLFPVLRRPRFQPLRPEG